jgi:hypothetical protein
VHEIEIFIKTIGSTYAKLCTAIRNQGHSRTRKEKNKRLNGEPTTNTAATEDMSLDELDVNDQVLDQPKPRKANRVHGGKRKGAGRPSHLSRFPLLAGTLHNFVNNTGPQADERRRKREKKLQLVKKDSRFNGKGTSWQVMAEYAMEKVVGLEEFGISDRTVAHICLPPRANSISADRYASSVNAKLPPKRNDVSKQHDNGHYSLAEMKVFQEMVTDHGSADLFSLDRKAKLHVANRPMVSRTAQIRGVYSVEDPPNYPDHDIPGQKIDLSGIQRLVDSIHAEQKSFENSCYTDPHGRLHLRVPHTGPVNLKSRAENFCQPVDPFTNAADFEPILEKRLQEGMTDFLLSVDGGADYMTKHQSLSYAFWELFRKAPTGSTSCMVLAIIRRAGGLSKFNNIEHFWAYVNHLAVGKTLTHKLNEDTKSPWDKAGKLNKKANFDESCEVMNTALQEVHDLLDGEIYDSHLITHEIVSASPDAFEKTKSCYQTTERQALDAILTGSPTTINKNDPEIKKVFKELQIMLKHMDRREHAIIFCVCEDTSCELQQCKKFQATPHSFPLAKFLQTLSFRCPSMLPSQSHPGHYETWLELKHRAENHPDTLPQPDEHLPSSKKRDFPKMCTRKQFPCRSYVYTSKADQQKHDLLFHYDERKQEQSLKSKARAVRARPDRILSHPCEFGSCGQKFSSKRQLQAHQRNEEHRQNGRRRTRKRKTIVHQPDKRLIEEVASATGNPEKDPLGSGADPSDSDNPVHEVLSDSLLHLEDGADPLDSDNPVHEVLSDSLLHLEKDALQGFLEVGRLDKDVTTNFSASEPSVVSVPETLDLPEGGWVSPTDFKNGWMMGVCGRKEGQIELGVASDIDPSTRTMTLAWWGPVKKTERPDEHKYEPTFKKDKPWVDKQNIDTIGVYFQGPISVCFEKLRADQVDGGRKIHFMSSVLKEAMTTVRQRYNNDCKDQAADADADGLSDYEKNRLNNIKRNQAKLAELGLSQNKPKPKTGERINRDSSESSYCDEEIDNGADSSKADEPSPYCMSLTRGQKNQQQALLTTFWKSYIKAATKKKNEYTATLMSIPEGQKRSRKPCKRGLDGVYYSTPSSYQITPVMDGMTGEYLPSGYTRLVLYLSKLPDVTPKSSGLAQAKVFLDIGHGTGKAVACAAIYGKFSQCIGIELSQPLVDLVRDIATEVLPSDLRSRCKFFKQDATQFPWHPDLNCATHIFIASCGMNPTTLTKIAKNLNKMPWQFIASQHPWFSSIDAYYSGGWEEFGLENAKQICTLTNMKMTVSQEGKALFILQKQKRSTGKKLPRQKVTFGQTTVHNIRMSSLRRRKISRASATG